jgi:hypothetical protein
MPHAPSVDPRLYDLLDRRTPSGRRSGPKWRRLYLLPRPRLWRGFDTAFARMVVLRQSSGGDERPRSFGKSRFRPADRRVCLGPGRPIGSRTSFRGRAGRGQDDDHEEETVEFNIWAGMLAGFVGTLAMTAVMKAGTAAGMTNMPGMPLMQGSMATDDPDKAKKIGMFTHAS